MKLTRLTVLLVALVLPPIASSSGAWNDPTSAQYHIQTDEGPERYFRYQTQSGQYRKEKRLEDGTVIGTYAWIDSDGLLRLRDYIADNQGYRILRTKNVFVGRDTPIDAAIKAAKKVSASNGILSKPNPIVTPRPSYQYNPPKYNVPQVQIIPNGDLPFGAKYPTSLPAHVSSLATTTELPHSTGLIHIPPTKPPTNYLHSVSNIPTSTPSSVYLPPSSPTDNFATSTPKYYEQSTPSNIYIPQSSTLSPPIDSNSVDYTNPPQYNHRTTPFVNPYIHQNGPTYPIDQNGHTFNSYTNKLGNGYNPQYPEYDGVSVTNDGFRYYIPKAYHEEQTLPGDKRSGSFGYIDPFGIRRVIYYNTSPGSGFQHRKNNRYVGLDATPYDPRPY